MSAIVGCLGIVVDAKDERAEAFCAKYDFTTLNAQAWPWRMFLPIFVVRETFDT